MAPRLRPRWHIASATAFLVISSLADSATAQDESDAESAALVSIGESMEKMMVGDNEDAISRTARGADACSASTRALVLMHIGIVTGSGTKDLSRARKIFVMALREDPALQIDRQFATKDTQDVFATAQAVVGDGPGTPPGATRLPPTPAQEALVSDALGQLGSGNWSGCMQTMIGELSSAEHAVGRLALALCQDKGGLLIEATADAQRALELAVEEGNDEVGAKARELLEALDVDTPRVILVIPASIDHAVVRIDTEEVDRKLATTDGIQRNPGKVTVEVTGKKGSYPFKFNTTERVDRGEQITIDVLQGASGKESGVQQCMKAAKTAEELNLCIETGGKGRGLTFRGGLEFSTYNDNDNVGVAAPALTLSLENPTSGWSLGGSVVVDVVTAASADIVATASRRFDQTRVAATLGGDYRFDMIKAGIGGGLSVESDYVGRSIGGSVSSDLLDKSITPTLGYTFGFDTLGLDETPYDEFSRDIIKHTIDASLSGVIDASTVALGGATLIVESGDQSKPYRHIPMFSSGVAERLPRGASASLVAATRLPPAPLEQLPEDRTRLALLGRVAHRFEVATIRGDERLYIDSWGTKASTTDLSFPVDVTKGTRVGPHVRFHIQSGVDFWKRAYVAEPNPVGFEVPEFRTGDRELGPLFAATLGGRLKHELTDNLSAGLQVDGIYTQFLDHIYIFDRIGVFTATTLELEVE